MTIEPIATIHSPLVEKFGTPRQSGLVEEIISRVELCEDISTNTLRGLEEFDHVWLIWGFSLNNPNSKPSPTVRPPRLGGNSRMGVFATRSPYRPNPLGLSCVKIESVDRDKGILTVRGADLVDGTPIYDIKPYIPYADSQPNSRAGFVDEHPWKELSVEASEEIRLALGDDWPAIEAVLREDPRPSYQEDLQRDYGLAFAEWNIRFRVRKDSLFVLSAEKTSR